MDLVIIPVLSDALIELVMLLISVIHCIGPDAG